MARVISSTKRGNVYQIEMDENEIAFIKCLLSRISGCPDQSYRKISDSLRKDLCEIENELVSTMTKKLTGGIDCK